MLSTTHYVSDESTKIEVSFDHHSASGWPVDLRLATGRGSIDAKLIVSLTRRQSVALFAQLRDVLVEAEFIDPADLMSNEEARKRELREIADRLLGLSGADDDLVRIAEANVEPV